MAAVINTNIPSLNAQRNLSTSQSQLATSLQRLSSGLRINSAKDDAAGLAISERFSTQIRGMNVAVRNANDGISLAQSAEGAMTEIGNNLQRIRELAVQSRNATNSDSDRTALNAEAQQLKAEVDRVASTTAFNNTKLLDGSFTAKAFQVGANQGETIDIAKIVNASSGALGDWTSVTTAAVVAGANTVAPTGTTTGGSSATPATQTVGALTDGAGGDATSTYTATFTAGTDTFSATVTGATVAAADLSAAFVAAGFAADGTGTVAGFTLDIGAAANIAAAITANSLTVNRADGTNFDYAQSTAGTAYTTAPSLAGLATSGTTTDGVGATSATTSFAAIASGELTINGANIIVGTATSAADRVNDLVAAINASTTAGVTASNDSGKLSLTAKAGTADIVIAGSAASAVLSGLTAGTTSGTPGTAQTGFATLDISTTAGADNAILAMDAALTTLNGARADMGAVQNRFTSVVTSLQTTSENMTASRSRILDADFAAETANLTRGQILQQAGTAMLAQANSLPNGVLALLRG